MSLEGRLFENIDRFVEKIKEMESREFDVDAGKNSLNRFDEYEILDGKVIMGVDGSQLQPLRDFGIPFGGVQSAGIIVHHGKGEFEVFHRSRIVSDTNLEFERFKLEIETLREGLDSVDLAFFDGSLGALYTAELSDALRKAYRKEIESLIKESERKETPVIGYVDRSFTRDLKLSMYDSIVLSEYLEMYEFTEPIDTKSPLKAVYFKLNPLLPVRIEIPEWCTDILKEIIEIVYAESRLGSTGAYPYILERAHVNARISEKEKSAFVKAIKSTGISFKFLSKVVE